MKKNLLFLAVMAISLTQAQVSLVKDINLGSGDGVTDQFVKYNNLILFSGNNVTDGFELWASDGTTTGTNFITSGSSAYNPTRFYYSTSLGEVVYNAGTSNSLHKTDGTLSGTQIIGTSALDASDFIDFQNNLYCTSDVFFGRQMSIVLSTGSGLFDAIGTNPDPKGYTEYNGQIYFSAAAASTNREIWTTDTSSTNAAFLFFDVNPGSSNSNPKDFTVFNNKLYFTADDGTNGREIWVTDGSSGGTEIVLDLNSGTADANPENLTVFNDALYFTATHPTLGIEIFKMNAAQNITNLKNIASETASSFPADLFVFDGKLYFSADDTINGRELWSTTGFSLTTNLVKNINTSSSNPDSNPTGFVSYFDELFFSADNDTNGRELWKTDGTDAGTVLVSDINTSGNSNPENLTVVGDNLFFSATTTATGKELFKYRDPSLSIENLELEQMFSIYPNPATHYFSIVTTSEIKNISVYNLHGKLVKTFEKSQDQYSIKDLTAGLYFVNISTINGAITKKVIKE